MTINERLRYLRNYLNLTTRAFGASINMSGGAITNMEKGTRNITERTIKDISNMYNINIDWFINGNEPMFNDILQDINVTDDVKQTAMQYSLLNPKDKELVKSLLDTLAEKNKK